MFRLSDHLNMTIAVDWDIKPQTKQTKMIGRVVSGKKFWKTKKIPGQGKVRELHFQSGKLKKK